MLAPNRKEVGRLAPVRLTDVPLPIRRRVGNRLIEQARLDGDLLTAVHLRDAIERPSARVNWVPARAVERVLG
jgi:hypothetical protein